MERKARPSEASLFLSIDGRSNLWYHGLGKMLQTVGSCPWLLLETGLSMDIFERSVHMKKAVSMILVACMLATMIPFHVIAAEAEMPVKAYPFSFTGAVDMENDVSGTCYYSDSYFLEDAAVYDSQLATMSLCFELTTWARAVDQDGWTTDVSKASDAAWKNAYDLLDQLGFRDFAVNEYWAASPTMDSIGAVAASKDLDGHTLIALGIRGGGYGQEWASNFTVGKTGEHDGFAMAKEDVLAFLADYTAACGITGQVKLWLVGYSRAGCVANMVAGELDRDSGKIPGVTIDQEDLFAYTFEAAQGTTQELAAADYPNIHNIINLNDIVPLVAPTSWGFDRYGVDRFLPSAHTSGDFDAQLEKMLVHFDGFRGDTEYAVPEYGTEYSLSLDLLGLFRGESVIKIKETQVPTQELMTEASGVLFDDVIGGREVYVEQFQDTFRQVMALLFGGSLTNADAQAILDGLTAERLVQVVAPMVTQTRLSVAQRKTLVRQELEALVDELLEAAGITAAVDLAAELKDDLVALLWGLLEAVLDDLARFDTSSLQALVNVIGMVADGGFLQAHYPEVTLAWMMSQDENYESQQTPEEPEVTEPEETEPEVTEPEVTEPEVTEPEVTEPEETEPEVTEPEATEPEETEPESGSIGSFFQKLFGWLF